MGQGFHDGLTYAPDARIVAEVLACQADYLVTHDQEHLLRNPRLDVLPLKVGTPGGCLAWIRRQLPGGKGR